MIKFKPLVLLLSGLTLGFTLPGCRKTVTTPIVPDPVVKMIPVKDTPTDNLSNPSSFPKADTVLFRNLGLDTRSFSSFFTTEYIVANNVSTPPENQFQGDINANGAFTAVTKAIAAPNSVIPSEENLMLNVFETGKFTNSFNDPRTATVTDIYTPANHPLEIVTPNAATGKNDTSRTNHFLVKTTDFARLASKAVMKAGDSVAVKFDIPRINPRSGNPNNPQWKSNGKSYRIL